MAVERDSGVHGGDAALGSRLASWVAAARQNENFAGGGIVVLSLVTIAMLILHSATYAVNVHNPVAFGGALVGLAASVLAVTIVIASFRTWPRGRWRGMAVVVLLVALFFALLPPITAGHGWLTLLLFVITTFGYEAMVATWLVIARPWTWMQGAPE
ncbi:hypothetical protein ACIBVK_06650 [Micromonospora echinofusca]|uniref:hypothetical protein n=1 Tax=Micromonospora echinofusca TaxID=47858 RepID=UPI00378A143A